MNKFKPKKENKCKSDTISYSIFSDYRGVIMGLATIMIVIFHSYLKFDKCLHINNFSINSILLKLNSGVDLFLLLSGIGLYYSWHNDPNLKHFYKKRALRILPTLFIFITLWSIYINPNLTFGKYLKSIFLIDFWANGQRGFWYFSLLIPLYLIYPLIHNLYDKYNLKGFISALLISFFITILIYLFIPNYYNIWNIALFRIPPFLIGAWFGKMAFEKKKFNKALLFFVTIIFILLIFIYGKVKFNSIEMMRLTEIIFSICILFIFSTICYRHNLKRTKNFLTWIGKYSMEIYLIFERVFIVLKDKYPFHESTGTLQAFCFFIITIILAIFLKNICNTLKKELFNQEQKVI